MKSNDSQAETSQTETGSRESTGRVVEAHNSTDGTPYGGLSRRAFIRVSGMAGAGFLLAACGPGTQPGTTTTPSPATTGAAAQPTTTAPLARDVEITYWYHADTPAIRDFFTQHISNFNARNTGVRVIGEENPDYFTTQEKLVSSVAVGEGYPDAAYFASWDTPRFYDSGIVHPVEEFLPLLPNRDDFQPGVEDLMRFSPANPVLALPHGLGPNVHYYQAQVYDELGLSAPDTWEQLVENARAANDPPDRFGIGIRGLDWVGFAFNFLDHLYNFGLMVVDPEGNTDLDTPAGIAAGEAIVGIVRENLTPPSFISDGTPELVARMREGSMANWSSNILHNVVLRGEDHEFDDVLGVSVFPHGEGHDRKVMTTANLNVITEPSQNKEAAFEFISSFLEPEPMARYVEVRGELPPTATVASQDFIQDDPFLRVAVDSAPYYTSYPVWHKNWNDLTTTMVQEWQRTLLDEISVDDLMASLANTLRDV